MDEDPSARGLTSDSHPSQRVLVLAKSPRPPATPAADSKQVRSLLRSADRPSQSMDYLLKGDPLDLVQRSCAVLRTDARVLDPLRMHSCAAARVAFRGAAWKGQPPLDLWLARCIREAVRDCLAQDEEEERLGQIVEEGNAHKYAVMTELLGCSIDSARIAMLTFNRLPAAERHVAFSVLVLGRELETIQLPQTVRDSGNRPVSDLFAEAITRISAARPGKIPPPSPVEYDLSSANE